MSDSSNADDVYGDGQVPEDADLNAPLPDPGPGDGMHEGDDWEVGTHGTDERSSDQKADDDSADTSADGSLSPGSTATDSPTALD